MSEPRGSRATYSLGFHWSVLISDGQKHIFPRLPHGFRIAVVKGIPRELRQFISKFKRVHRAREGGNLNVALEGWGIWTRFICCSEVIGPWFFLVLGGVTDLQDRTSPLLVNNFLKRVFKRRLKVSLLNISLWKACKVLDWRPNLSLRRGSSVLIERLSCPEWREFEQANLQKFKFSGACPGGGDVELSNWSEHYPGWSIDQLRQLIRLNNWFEMTYMTFLTIC